MTNNQIDFWYRSRKRRGKDERYYTGEIMVTNFMVTEKTISSDCKPFGKFRKIFDPTIKGLNFNEPNAVELEESRKRILLEHQVNDLFSTDSKLCPVVKYGND